MQHIHHGLVTDVRWRSDIIQQLTPVIETNCHAQIKPPKILFPKCKVLIMIPQSNFNICAKMYRLKHRCKSRHFCETEAVKVENKARQTHRPLDKCKSIYQKNTSKLTISQDMLQPPENDAVTISSKLNNVHTSYSPPFPY